MELLFIKPQVLDAAFSKNTVSEKRGQAWGRHVYFSPIFAVFTYRK